MLGNGASTNQQTERQFVMRYSISISRFGIETGVNLEKRLITARNEANNPIRFNCSGPS